MKQRLDQALVERRLVRSRSQGREFILAGRVSVDGVPCLKPGRLVTPQSAVALDSEVHAHRVGRGYDKLAAFLEEHPLDFAGRFVVDGGSSTGGFTQLALEKGARQVLAVDLGADQLDSVLREDPRVIVREGLDLRAVRELPAPCEILLLDLSFVSLLDVIGRLDFPLASGAHLLALVKPQFELPAEALTGSGRVRRDRDAQKALAAVLARLAVEGWEPLSSACVEPGPDQINREFFVLARRAE